MVGLGRYSECSAVHEGWGGQGPEGERPHGPPNRPPLGRRCTLFGVQSVQAGLSASSSREHNAAFMLRSP